MSVHIKSLELAEEWLAALPRESPLGKREPLAPSTVQAYRDDIVGRDAERMRVPKLALLTWWAEEAPGEPIWEMVESDLIDFLHMQVRDGLGADGFKPPSASVYKKRRAATLSFFMWLKEKGFDLDRGLITYKTPYEEKADERRREVKLRPILDGTFRSIQTWRDLDPDSMRMVGQAAFMTQRIGEVANMRPEDVDLERHRATFRAKGGKKRTVNYGELTSYDWPLLDHLEDFHETWVRNFEDHAEQCQEAQRRDPDQRWLCTLTEGEPVPRRDARADMGGRPSKRRQREAPSPTAAQPLEDWWRPTVADLKRMDTMWQHVLTGAGFPARSNTFHQLRHFSATNMWRAGVRFDRLKAEVGHSMDLTTYAYIDLRPGFDAERTRNEHRRTAA